VANWFDRLKPLKGRAGLDLMSSAALLLIISGPQALAEDEPAARAPLPPMLRGTPAEARERQRPDPAPKSQSVEPSHTGDQVRSTEVPIVAKEASPPFRLAFWYFGRQEVGKACTACGSFD